MNPLLLIRSIPLTDLLFIAGLVVALLLLTRLWIRRQRPRSSAVLDAPVVIVAKSRSPVWNMLAYFLRLVGFAILAFVIIGGSVLIYKDYQEITEEIAPTPSNVEIPGDLSFSVQEVTFIGGDGLKLAGWYIPPRNDAVIILLHGYGSNRTAMLWHAQTLVEAGYGVFMYDERGSGESQGKNRSYGWQDAPDVGGAISFIREHSDGNTNHIGIIGCSIGGQIALQAAANYPEIKAVWADGASGILASDNPSPDNWANGIAFLSNYILDWMLSQRLDIQAPPPMTEIIAKIAPRPLMLVAGGFPRPYFGNEASRIQYLAEYTDGHAEVWIIPEAVHCDGPSRRPEDYTHRMVGFFDKAFDTK